MPIIVLALGVLLLMAAYNNTVGALFTQLGSDFPGFAVWAGAILLLYLVSRIPGFTGAAKLFLALLVIVFIIKNQGVFQQFSSALQSGAQAPQQAQIPSLVSGTPAPITLNGGGGSGGAGGVAGSAASAIGGSLLGGVL